ncbi:hypothetical protein LQF12_10750 [Ruania suaedae]|uniref:AMIN-like domain-containing (lipo)protein n=1 Tax=Ruania suaedae TaxID=2897774 RepID=UPI001E333A33|nr:hypothetical protein [Ruania suaedae]UFU01992.1 hypothetical protein LQF12_10750 [Ruania suaedae]
MRPMHTRYLPLAVLTATALSLAGCTDAPEESGEGTTDQPDPTTSAPAEDDTESPSPEPTEEESTEDTSQDSPAEGSEPFPADTSRDTQAAEGGYDLLLVEARTGRHDGYDRVVLEFTGSGTPGWVGEYVEDPVEDGSGRPIDIEGEAALQVTVEGTRYPDKTDDYFSPAVLPVEGEAIEEADIGGTFEGYTQVIVGVEDEGSPFRVFSLTDPTRVVIDVQDVED